MQNHALQKSAAMKLSDDFRRRFIGSVKAKLQSKRDSRKKLLATFRGKSYYIRRTVPERQLACPFRDYLFCSRQLPD
jgi:hypothetical protein